MKYLLEKEAAVDKRDEETKTPLAHAFLHNSIDIVRVLVAFGADCRWVGGNGNNLFHLTINEKMARLLIEDVPAPQRQSVYTLLTSKNSKWVSPLDIAEQCEVFYNRRDLCYLWSFSKMQVAVAVSESPSEFEACSRLNPNLSKFQLRYVSKICNLLEWTVLGQDLTYRVLGFLSPLDLMNE